MNPNKGTSDEVLRRLKEESYERLRANIFEAVRKQLDDYGMTWDDLAKSLQWKENLASFYGAVFGPDAGGSKVKERIGGVEPLVQLTLDELNDIAHAFSAEVYVIFRPRFPFVNS